MTNATHTQTALLVAAVETLNAQLAAAKKAGLDIPGIGAEIAPGIKLRDLKTFLKEFKAKQADASKPAAAAAPVKPAKADAVEFTAKELKGADLLVGRVRDTINSVVKSPEGVRVAVTASGLRVPVADLERNNRGNLRVKLDSKAVAPKGAATAHDSTKPATKKADTKPAAEELKAADIRAAGVLLNGRVKENVVRISKVNDVRVVVTDKGNQIAIADLEINNRGTLRVKLEQAAKYAAGAAPVKTEGKPAAKKAADDDFEAEPEIKAAQPPVARQFPIRVLNIKKSAQLTGAEYDRNTQTLFVTLKDAVVWAHEGVKLSEARAFEESALPWKHYSTIVKAKPGRMVKGHKPQQASAPVKAETKPAPAPKAAPRTEISTTALREQGFIDGRKTEQVEKIVRNKETGERVVITVSGKRVPLDAIIEAKGKFRTSDLALISGAVEKAGNASREAKAPVKAPVNGKAPKADFAQSEKENIRKAKPAADLKQGLASRDEVKNGQIRVVKGSKEKVVNALRIVSRDGVSTVVTEARGHIPRDQIVWVDGQLTYVGKLTASEFHAL